MMSLVWGFCNADVVSGRGVYTLQSSYSNSDICQACSQGETDQEDALSVMLLWRDVM